jgi:hypothetical protein
VIHLQIWPVFPTQDQMDISKQIGRIVNRFGLAAVRVGTPGRSIKAALPKIGDFQETGDIYRKWGCVFHEFFFMLAKI